MNHINRKKLDLATAVVKRYEVFVGYSILSQSLSEYQVHCRALLKIVRIFGKTQQILYLMYKMFY